MNALIVRSANANAPILLYLHGVGEAFRNHKIRNVGVRNLLRQGVPKVLCAPDAVLSPRHPLMQGQFTVVAPQLPHRDASWAEHVEGVNDLLNSIPARNGRKVYIIAFSKGGRGAFDIANAIGCAALVTIDAAPMADGAEAVGKVISACQIPFWAISTRYPEGKFAGVQALHQQIDVPVYDAGYWDELSPPAGNSRTKSIVVMDHEPDDARHVALCTAICTSGVPYTWLLRH
jgi:hypothetical protein